MAVFDKCLALTFSLMILGQAYLVKRFVGTWLFPACLFGLFWFGMTFVPLILLLKVPLEPWGIGFILLCLTAFSSSALIFPWGEAFKKNILKKETTPFVYGNSFLRKTFYVLSFLTIACIVIDSLAQGVSLRDLIYDLLATAASYRELGSRNLGNVTVFDRISEIFIYDVAVLGGMLITSASTKLNRFRIILCSFAPGVLMAVVRSSKWDLFACIAFFYAGLLTYRISRSDFALFKRGFLKKAALCSAALILITTVSFMSRGLQNSEDTDFIRDRLKLLFVSYSCGHVYGLSEWFSSYMAERFGTEYHSQTTYSREHATYGLYTFGPIFRTLGSKKVIPVEMFDEDYEYGDILIGNIYTMFRGLIQDFGLLGSLLFMFLAGLLIHWAFFRMLLNENATFTVTVFVFSIGFFYASFVRSIFDWSGMYFTFVLLWIVLQINKLVTQMEGRRLAMATGVPAQP